jgi:hypothetical protein
MMKSISVLIISISGFCLSAQTDVVENTRDTVQAWMVYAQLADGAPVRVRKGFAVYDYKTCQPVVYLDSRFRQFPETIITHQVAEWATPYSYFYRKYWPLRCAAGTVTRMKHAPVHTLINDK